MASVGVSLPPNSCVNLNKGLEVSVFINEDRNQTYFMDEDQMLNLFFSAENKMCGPFFKIHDQFQVGNSRTLNQTIHKGASSQAWTPYKHRAWSNTVWNCHKD